MYAEDSLGSVDMIIARWNWNQHEASLVFGVSHGAVHFQRHPTTTPSLPLGAPEWLMYPRQM